MPGFGAGCPPLMFLDECTGRGVRIAIVDSGVHAAHPHVHGVAGGIGVNADGTETGDYIDRLGHGTAVAAAIREKAPDADLFAVKIFWTALASDIRTLVAGIQAAARGAALVNLSLGTADARHRTVLEAAVAEARRRGALIVAAAEASGATWLPGSLDGVVAVELDWSCDRHEYRIVESRGGRRIAASGFPRDIPGVPRERNLSGISFAVANATGFVARALERAPGASIDEVLHTLAAGIPARPFAGVDRRTSWRTT